MRKRIDREVVACRTRGFIIYPKGKHPAWHEAYYADCKRRKAPYVWLELHRTTANLQIDHPWCDSIPFDGPLREEMNSFLRQLDFKQMPQHRSINIRLADFPAADGERLAAFLNDLATRFCIEHGVS